jgi:hypothetical protein
MIDGLHIPIWNRKKNPLALALRGEGWGGRDDGDNVTNILHKSNQNCHYEFLLYNKYNLIKKRNKYKRHRK